MLNRDVLRFASAILNYSSRGTKTEEEWELNLLVLRLFRIIFYNITRPVIDWKSVPYPSTAKAVTSSANLSSKNAEEIEQLEPAEGLREMEQLLPAPAPLNIDAANLYSQCRRNWVGALEQDSISLCSIFQSFIIS